MPDLAPYEPEWVQAVYHLYVIRVNDRDGFMKQMAGAGLKTYTEIVSTQSGEVTRVRAGPYPTREAAERARTQLKKAGHDGKVVPK